MFKYIASIILIFSGGFSWFFVKMHSGYSLPVEFSIFYRNVFASLFLIISLIIFGKGKALLITKAEFKLCFQIGILYYFLYFLGAYYGSIFLISGIVSFIAATKMIFVECIVSIKEKRRPTGRIIVAACVGIIGIILMSKGNMNVEHLTIKQLLFGVSFAFLSPISNAFSFVTIKFSDAKKTLNSFTLAAFGGLIGSFFVLILGLIKNKGTIVMFPLESRYLIGLAFLSLASSGLITVITYYLIDKIGPVKTTFMSMAHPPLAFLLAFYFQNYHLDLMTLLGCLCCLYSLFVGLKYQARKKRYVALSKRRKILYRKFREQHKELKKKMSQKWNIDKKQLRQEFK